MKRIGIFLVLILMITFSVSCNTGNKQQKNNEITKKVSEAKSFSAIVRIKKGNSEYKFKLTKTDDKIIKGEIIDPALLKGFWIELENDKYKTGYMGLEIAGDELPESAASVVDYLYHGINLIEGKAKITDKKKKSEGEIIVSCKLPNGIGATLIFDAGTFLPLKINFDNNDITITFESFDIINTKN